MPAANTGLVEMSAELSGLQNIGMVELAQLVNARPRVLGDSALKSWMPDIQASLSQMPGCILSVTMRDSFLTPICCAGGDVCLPRLR